MRASQMETILGVELKHRATQYRYDTVEALAAAVWGPADDSMDEVEREDQLAASRWDEVD